MGKVRAPHPQLRSRGTPLSCRDPRATLSPTGRPEGLPTPSPPGKRGTMTPHASITGDRGPWGAEKTPKAPWQRPQTSPPFPGPGPPYGDPKSLQEDPKPAPLTPPPLP